MEERTKRVVKGQDVWTIKHRMMSWDEYWKSRERTEDLEDETNWKERERFMKDIMTFLRPHMSRVDEQVLLDWIADIVIESYKDMTYTHDYISPSVTKLVKFLKDERKKLKEKKKIKGEEDEKST